MSTRSIHTFSATDRYYLLESLKAYRETLGKATPGLNEAEEAKAEELDSLIKTIGNPKPLPKLLVHVDENGLEGIYATDLALLGLDVTTIDYDAHGASPDQRLYVRQSDNTLYLAKSSKTHVELQTVELVPLDEVEDACNDV